MKTDPYRIFFPLGIAFGLAGVSIWPLYTLGVTATYSGRAHALVQADGFLYAFIAGFLLTAVPRFTGTDVPSRLAQWWLALTLVVAVAASELRAFTIGTSAFAVAHGTVIALVGRRSLRGGRIRRRPLRLSASGCWPAPRGRPSARASPGRSSRRPGICSASGS